MNSDARPGGCRISNRTLSVHNVIATVAAIFPLFCGGGLGASPAYASDNPDLTAEPRQLIEETAHEIVSILAKSGDADEIRVAKIERLAYEIFDFTTMSKLVLARNWRKIDSEKRAEFVREFKRYLSRIYGKRLGRYSQEEIDVYAAQVEVRDDVSIKTRIVGGEFDNAEIAYRLRHRKGQWRIIDVVIEGVSLVSSYRSQFALVLNSGTIDELLAKLRDKNFVVAGEVEKEG
ncbi:MAG: ABC transporter substrate-binding protein [bacterium]|nr:ABC transporter substrate-binding protein [bacterium]